MGERASLAVEAGSALNGRRTFVRRVVTTMGALFASPALPRTVRAAAVRMPRIGYPTLVPVRAGHGSEFLEAFRQGLSAHGYREGKNIAIELRDAGGMVEHLPRVVKELVELPVSVLVLPLSNTVPMAAKATRSIPIVSTLIGDPVALGLAESFARPKANVTGLTVYNQPLTGKRLELLKEVAPAVRRVGLLRNSEYPETARDLDEAKLVAPRLRLDIVPLEFNRLQDMESVLESGVRDGIDSLVVVPDAVSVVHSASIVRFATAHRLPGVYPYQRFTDPSMGNPGGLIAFGPDRLYNFTRAAFYVDRLLKGTRPQDLPFEQPTRFWLSVSMRAARFLNLTVPSSLLVRADAVFD